MLELLLLALLVLLFDLQLLLVKVLLLLSLPAGPTLTSTCIVLSGLLLQNDLRDWLLFSLLILVNLAFLLVLVLFLHVSFYPPALFLQDAFELKGRVGAEYNVKAFVPHVSVLLVLVVDSLLFGGQGQLVA
ncbi:MAG: hypothetical protein ACMG6E_06370 [Candidatus Roizmanbacteria bacterium]